MFVRHTRHLKDTTNNYTIGEYHTCYVGEVLSERYTVLKKLAMTRYASVWVAKDVSYNIYVTIKIFRSAQHYNEMALEEVDKLQLLHRRSREEAWMRHMSRRKGDLSLATKVPDTENFCVK